ncbi:MAG: glycogen/starch/alpha-glucan phosphorylase [SAR324 cluster bacterium]|nr:glycogen/starch/alpha-glucan phosphorylase [SAR324 cluster bacterium]
MSAQETNKLWQHIAGYRKMDKDSFIESIANHLEFSLCKNRYTVDNFDIYYSLALSVRDRMVELWNDTQQTYHNENAKRVYYLSLEYLMGRSLSNSLINLGIYDTCKQALAEIGYDINDIEELEHDAGLGNGGLGRLAACFLDSMATLQLPAYGYGIRYEYGIFNQKIENCEQVEHPDNWLRDGYPWEIPRWDMVFPVQFFGRVHEYVDSNGKKRYELRDTQDVMAMAYDVPIPGFKNHTVNNLRLWSARPTKEFDFHMFNKGDYFKAVEEEQKSETLSKVLYPNDKGFAGKELRLKQQFFFVSASLQDLIRRYKTDNQSFDKFPDQVAIQLNDTHPSIAVPELMRLLIDIEGLEWDTAWDITKKVFAYTNHTVLPEALERWPLDMLGNLLPRQLQIIYLINHNFLQEVRKQFPGDESLIGRVSLVSESGGRQIIMPHLAIVGSHAVNGVSALHTELLKTTVLKDFYAIYPEKFQNKTNGITPRRWLRECNQELSALITSKIGEGWVTNLDELKKLIPLADDKNFQKAWQNVKLTKKKQFAQWLKDNKNIEINPNSMFDVQIKRIHEYKRQLLNILHVITMYSRIISNPNGKHVPRTVILGGKAAPGYYMAKLMIQLANDVARTINNNPAVGDKLRVVFVENYGVSLAEKIMPATELSQHISTAGTEASGTGNMKFCLNGAIIIGTLDGANIEIMEEVGEENTFIFGLKTPEVMALQAQGYNPRVYYQAHEELQKALEMINTGYFNRNDPHLYNDIYNSLVFDDQYLLLADYASYIACQEKVSETYSDQAKWTRMSILNTANMGKFSSDRTIDEYAKDIWDVKPVKIRPVGQKIR